MCSTKERAMVGSCCDSPQERMNGRRVDPPYKPYSQVIFRSFRVPQEGLETANPLTHISLTYPTSSLDSAAPRSAVP